MAIEKPDEGRGIACRHWFQELQGFQYSYHAFCQFSFLCLSLQILKLKRGRDWLEISGYAVVCQGLCSSS